MNTRDLPYVLDGVSYTAYLATPDPVPHRWAPKAPGILVCPDAGGLREHARSRARQLADLGYVALAIDLYGEPITSPDHAKAMMTALSADIPTFRRRLNGALDTLKATPGVDPDRTAAIGFCFGGAAALELARSGADVSCVVGFHATLGTAAKMDAHASRARILVCLGARDPLVPEAQRAAFVAEMTSAGADWQMLLLDAVHGFTDPGVDAYGIAAVRYDEKADRRSWRAMRGLFDEVFGAGSSPPSG
jgi:dienelactone hydrolase